MTKKKNVLLRRRQKCRPEYKIPGLYVIDSIVRQSRHQFGPDKDVFAGRFAKNIRATFYNLYKCTEEEKVGPIGNYFLVSDTTVAGRYGTPVQKLNSLKLPQMSIFSRFETNEQFLK